jgi:hypothetical protein
MDWGNAGLLTFVAALGTAVGAALKIGVDFYQKYKADKRLDVNQQQEIVKYRDEQVKDGLQILVASQQTRISNLETMLIKSQADHLGCTEALAGFRMQATLQQKELDDQQKEINELRQRLDGMNHKTEKQK